ncbi:quinone oxidoreductase family protein [Streptomyces iconiensis]|uniref:Quinone oxidoreductase n=1 Tax=Streptomyces iconiensis TaxID=1384038 RepID=A0ABT6ZUK9_9ACTN|nr:quinone oxidoreductase [Streptomyces iconiensis]MDJ1132754.1 quinone oxidoreductase [Streptomyces iconiensis]
MKTVRVHKPGGPEQLVVEEPEQAGGPGQAGEPERKAPEAGHVLVRHAAVGVNFIDVYYRDGSYASELPFVPGQEAAGTVLATGEGVSGFAAGDTVAYATHRGAYAQTAAVPAGKLVPVPGGVTARDAAAVLLQGLAAHYLTHDTHPVGAGETVVVLAAAGGLGRLLVQLAAHRGATVIAVVSSDEKEKVAREAGARHTLRYAGFAERVRELTGGAGARVVYDSVGADTFGDSLGALGPRGMLVLCGASSGPVPPLDTGALRAGGSLYVTRPKLADHVRDSAALRSRAAEVFALCAAGALRPLISRELPLEGAAEAHRLLEARSTTGKLLLLP